MPKLIQKDTNKPATEDTDQNNKLPNHSFFIPTRALKSKTQLYKEILKFLTKTWHTALKVLWRKYYSSLKTEIIKTENYRTILFMNNDVRNLK